MKIAIMGTRGVPANYGGFETFAEELGQRLVKKGHQVTVYCRRGFGEKVESPLEYKGIKRVILPAPHHKYFETVVHTFFSLLHVIFHKVDVIILCNAANSPVAWLAKIARIPVLINVDGIERRRKKWNFLGRLWYRLGEFCSVLFATKIISDADVIADYYKNRFKTDSVVIRYGAEASIDWDINLLKDFDLTSGKYWLYVARLEPENNALGVIEAYKSSNSKIPLVIVGDAPYAREYKQQLKERSKGCNVIFTGYQFGVPYKTLGANCYAYIQASEVGGTHPALVEAMARGNCILANDVPEHREVIGDAGLLYNFNDFKILAEKMDFLENNFELVQTKREEARRRASELFSWNSITEKYESLCSEVIK